MSRTIALLLVVLSLCLGVGCQSKVPQPIGSLVGPIDLQRIGYTPTWSRELLIPNDQSLEHVAIMGDQLVIAETPSRITHAISLRDGSRMWSRVVGTKLTDLVGVSRWKDRVVINSSSDLFLLDAATGDSIRSYQLPYTVQSAPSYSGDTAIFGSARDRVFTFDMPNGFRMWDFGMGAGFVARPLVLENDRVFIADLAGSWAMLDVGERSSLYTGRAFKKITAAPVANNRTIFIVSEDSSLYAIDRYTGDDEWIFRSKEPLKESAVVLGNWLYLPLAQQDQLVAIDPSNGKEMWRLAGKPKPLHLIGKRLIVATSQGLMVVDNESGTVLSEVATKPLRAALAGPDNSILLIARGGRLERFDLAK